MAENISEQKLKDAVEQRNQKINEYIRRQAVIKSLYGDKLTLNSTLPKSVRRESELLVTLIDSLKTSRRDIWGQTISTDGCAVDGFVKEKYEKALAEWTKVRETNKDWIAENIDKHFKFPEVDFDGIRAEMQEIRTTDDFDNMSNKLIELSQKTLPEDVQGKIYELRQEFATIDYNELISTEMPPKRSERNKNKALVNRNKFAQIYGKAKMRISEVFSKIKGMLNSKSNKKEDNDLDK